ILAARIAQAHKQFHVVLQKKEATRRPPRTLAQNRSDYSASASLSPSVPEPASADFRPDGATMVAMVKSRSWITGVTPLGRSTAEMWIESPMSRPDRSTTM